MLRFYMTLKDLFRNLCIFLWGISAFVVIDGIKWGYLVIK